MEILTVIVALAIAVIAFKFLMGLLRIGVLVAMVIVGAILATRGGFA